MTISVDQREVPREIQTTTGASGSLPPNRLLVFVLPAILVMMMTSAQVCHSQNSAPPSSKDAQGQKRNDSSTQPSGHERMFGIVPAYGLVEAGAQPPPLTSGQKFGLAVQYFNPYTFVFIAAEAGFNQALDSPKEFGQGAEGYGKRYGAGFADGLTAAIFTTGVYPSLLRQDPRYYRLGDGNWPHRTEYSLTRILVTRQDSGKRAFNFSEVLGSFSSSALAVTYYPKSQRDFSDVAERAGIQFAFDAGFNLLKEFYPDIERKLFHKKHK